MRSVTQGDVIRADAKDIPRIFQVRIALPVTHTRRNLVPLDPSFPEAHWTRGKFLTLLKEGGEIKGYTELFMSYCM